MALCNCKTKSKFTQSTFSGTTFFFFLPLCLWHTLFSSKMKNEDGLFKIDNSNGPSCNVLLNLSSVNYVVERNLPA